MSEILPDFVPRLEIKQNLIGMVKVHKKSEKLILFAYFSYNEAI